MDELESTEKVYQHRVVSVRMGFGCQDCLKWDPELNSLVSKPCKKVVVPSLPSLSMAKVDGNAIPSVKVDESAIPSVKVDENAIPSVKVDENAIPSEVDGSAPDSTGDAATLVKDLEAEYAYLHQEELMLELALLESLQEEEERLAVEAMRSHVNSTVSASSDCAPTIMGYNMGYRIYVYDNSGRA